MSAHTPGPWTYSADDEGGYMVQVERDAQPIARVAWFDQEANARLIAAAPAMLEALEYLSRQPDCSDSLKEHVISPVIRAAKGGRV